MTTYDPAVIQRSADRLYIRSVLSAPVSSFLGILIGFVAAPYILHSLPIELLSRLPDWVPAVALGIIGLGQGIERGAQLKLEAQAALCQMRIEQNTRRPATAAAVG